MITTLDTPPIRLIRHTSSQTPGSLPIPAPVATTQEPTTDSELQELEAQTSVVFEVAETQLATHSVAETQEPTTGIEVELQEFETSVAATQEPATDIELQELEAQTSFVFEVAETQLATHPVVETQELATGIEVEL